MDVVKQIDSSVNSFTKKPAANQSAAEQVKFLQDKIAQYQARLTDYAHEPIRRPSKEHKAIKTEIKALQSKLKEINKIIHKCMALKKAGQIMGKPHGKLIYNKVEYKW